MISNKKVEVQQSMTLQTNLTVFIYGEDDAR